jgi:hypothetical protein
LATRSHLHLYLANVALALCGTALLALPVARLPMRVPINYNEGWNAYQADRAMSGKPLYPPADSLLSNNYPPLSFYVVGIAGRVVGDNVVAGRLVALVSFLTVGLAIFFVVMATTRSPAGALFGALVFGVYALMHFPDYIAMDDPQWLAHALATSGLALLLWRGDRTHNASGFGAGVIMALALLVKHTLIALPAALLLELLLRRTRPLKAWAAGFGLTGLVSAIVCVATWGALVYTDVLLAPRVWSVWYSSQKVEQLVTPLLPLVVAVVLWLSSSGGWIRWRVFVVYAFCSLTLAVALLGGEGVVYNVLFDLTIALTILAGAAVSPGLDATAGSRHGFRVALAGAMAGTILVPAPAAALGEYADLQQLHHWQHDSEREIAIIAQHPDPVGCQTLVLCYWAGKEWSLDWFNARQKLRAGVIPERALLDPIERRRFTLLQIELRSHTPAYFVFPTVIERAIEENYTVVLTSSGRALLEPRSEAP